MLGDPVDFFLPPTGVTAGGFEHRNTPLAITQQTETSKVATMPRSKSHTRFTALRSKP